MEHSMAVAVAHLDSCPRHADCDVRAPVLREDVTNHVDALLGNLTEYIAELVLVFDDHGVCLAVNSSLQRLLGWRADEWVGQHGSHFVHPDDVALGLELFVSARATGAGVKEPVTYRLRHSDGGFVDMECIATTVNAGPGRFVFVVTGRPARIARDSTAIFDEVSRRVSAMFEESLIGMAQVALDGSILRANRQLAELVGGVAEELTGTPLEDLFRTNWDYGCAENHAELELRTTVTARTVTVRAAATLVRDWKNEPLYYAVQVSDITDLKDAELELRRRSSIDPLTGLSNRSRLELWGNEFSSAADTILLIDLDGFKAVNDTFGHRAGDEVLVAVADRLRHQTRESDVLARLGGDEIVIRTTTTSAIEAERMAARLADAIAQPVAVPAGLVRVGASVGVAIGRAGVTLAALLDEADVALYESKRRGGGTTVARRD
jgi:diguanylate cyclase (GGDEF)-like protein/PAS domain S-box-containing protein